KYARPSPSMAVSKLSSVAAASCCSRCQREGLSSYQGIGSFRHPRLTGLPRLSRHSRRLGGHLHSTVFDRRTETSRLGCLLFLLFVESGKRQVGRNVCVSTLREFFRDILVIKLIVDFTGDADLLCAGNTLKPLSFGDFRAKADRDALALFAESR